MYKNKKIRVKRNTPSVYKNAGIFNNQTIDGTIYRLCAFRSKDRRIDTLFVDFALRDFGLTTFFDYKDELVIPFFKKLKNKIEKEHNNVLICIDFSNSLNEYKRRSDARSGNVIINLTIYLSPIEIEYFNEECEYGMEIALDVKKMIYGAFNK